jgi:hypothetical protein
VPNWSERAKDSETSERDDHGVAGRTDIIDSRTDKLDRFAELWWGETTSTSDEATSSPIVAAQPALVIRAERV